MITIDAPISFLVGASIAVARRNEEGTAVQHRDRVLAKGLLFQSTILSPIILFFMSRFPDWEWNYFFDARAFFFESEGSLGFAALALVVALVNASFWVGFRCAEWLMAQGKLDVAKKVVIGTGVLILGTMAVLYNQSLHVGTYDEFEHGSAGLMFTHLEFVTILVVAGTLIAIGLGWLLRSERQHTQSANASGS